MGDSGIPFWTVKVVFPISHRKLGSELSIGLSEGLLFHSPSSAHPSSSSLHSLSTLHTKSCNTQLTRSLYPLLTLSGSPIPTPRIDPGYLSLTSAPLHDISCHFSVQNTWDRYHPFQSPPEYR